MSSTSRRGLVAGGSAAAIMAMPGLGLLGQALAAPRLKVAWVYTGPVADMGYTFEHDKGRQAVQARFGDAVQTHYVENVAEGPDCERVLRQLAESGDNMVFSTSFGFMNSVIRVARQFPDMKFEQATGYKTAANVAEYNLRFYQGRWVCGVIAGMLSKSGVAGYVAAYPIPEVIMGINAFTLAARSVNPAFRVKVIWINNWVDPGKEADAAKSLIDQGADILADHMDSSAVMQMAEQRGILAFGQSADRSKIAPHAQLTAIIDNWAPYYIRRVQAVLDGDWTSGSVWLGMKEGMVKMAPYGPGMTPAAKAAADKAQAGLIDGSVQPFAGPIADQSGTLRVPAGTVMSDSEVLKMDWLVKGT
jgi:simple sugar transport system substrate-binding protein